MKCAPVVHYLLMERAFDLDKSQDMGGARPNVGVVALWTANTKRCHFGEDTSGFVADQPVCARNWIRKDEKPLIFP
jgi:hypothetical protein